MRQKEKVITIVDRGGRTWSFGNYESPSGPAFFITVPDELLEWAANYSVHFDGTIYIEGNE